MRIHSRILLAVCFLMIVFSGCQAPQEPVTQESEEVFYPPAPSIPRLQFLKFISSSEDLGPQLNKKGGFESFIVGAEEEKTESISKPYGIALDDGKLYVCDVAQKRIRVLDLEKRTFGYMTKDRRLANPVNIHVNKGLKFVSDTVAEAVFVFGKDDQLKAILGKELNIKPVDVAVRGNRCYVADMASNRVVVIDINTDQELLRMGTDGDGPGGIALIGGLALDAEENVYATDKALARVTKFDKEGIFQMSFGKMGDGIYDFARPKGITIDKAGRLWIVDAAPQVTKVYDAEGQLLMFFGFPGPLPGSQNLPVTVIIDDDHVDLFREYGAADAQIEYLVLVSNQYGQKINVYGFGKFPTEEKRRADEAALSPGLLNDDQGQPEDQPEVQPEVQPEDQPVEDLQQDTDAPVSLTVF
ncbi:MAG: NHL repeat-containing protein [Planctomycetota bacterium]